MFMNDLLSPVKLWSRAEVLETGAVPRSPGVYAWYFRKIPPGVPTHGCVVRDNLTLLYVGIAPKAPPQSGAAASKATLRSRIRYHMRGNAEGSTLRLTLGCLLREPLGIQLRRVGSGTRMTFTPDGEALLSDWLTSNVYVCWSVTDRPWEAEASLINSICLPLNLAQNNTTPFIVFCRNVELRRRLNRDKRRCMLHRSDRLGPGER
jgi:hypothetical protein